MKNRMLGILCLIVCSALLAPAVRADDNIGLDARLAMPIMKAGEKQKNYLRVGLQGCKPEPSKARTPVNVAFVIDRSGSMSGDSIAQAREAAIMAVSRLNANDIASVVIFDHVAEVLIRVHHQYRLEMHVDVDEGNAVGLKNGDLVQIIK